jgi:hypothetical protein
MAKRKNWCGFPDEAASKGAPVLVRHMHRNSMKRNDVVIPAKAGIQPILIRMSYEGLGPSLRWDDGLLDFPSGPELVRWNDIPPQ